MSAQNKQSEHNYKEKLMPMPEKILADFKDLLEIPSSSDMENIMVAYIVSRLHTMNDITFDLDVNGNILVTKGQAETYPCVVAHMDTVHSIRGMVDVLEVQHGGRTILTSPDGIGGDDKCGIYSVFYALKMFKNVKAVFFTQEETGCVGSNAIEHDFFDDCGYIIQLDRWGRGDFIDTYYSDPTVSPEYSEAAAPVLQKFGYKSTEGLFTDSITLHDNGVGISCVNVSCGYYEHHTKNEKIDTHEFYNSLRFLRSLIKALGENRYESRPEMKTKKYGGRYRYYDYSGGVYEDDDLDWGIGTGVSKPDRYEYSTETPIKIEYLTQGCDQDIVLDILDYMGIGDVYEYVSEEVAVRILKTYKEWVDYYMATGVDYSRYVPQNFAIGSDDTLEWFVDPDNSVPFS